MEKSEKEDILKGIPRIEVWKRIWSITVLSGRVIRSMRWCSGLFDGWNLIKMNKETKTKLIEEFRTSEKDCGSTEVQVAILTTRIVELTEHMKIHKKDNSTKRGLLALVNRRRRLLLYLQKEDYSRYSTLIKKLGLRH